MTPDLSDELDEAAAVDSKPVKATDCATAAFNELLDEDTVNELAVETNEATVSASALAGGNGMSGTFQIHDAEGVEEIEFVGVREKVAPRVGVDDVETVDDGVAPKVTVAVSVAVGETDKETGDDDALGVRLDVLEGEDEASRVPVALADTVDDVDGVAPFESEAVGVCVDVIVAVGVVDTEAVVVALSEPDAVGEIDGDAPTLRDEVGVADSVDDSDELLEGVSVGVAVSEEVREGVGVEV